MFLRIAFCLFTFLSFVFLHFEGLALADDVNLSPLNKTLNLDPFLFGGFIDTYYAYDTNEFSPRTRDYLTHLRTTMGTAARNLDPFEDAYKAADWSRFDKLPLFRVANRMNAYNTYLLMEQESK